MTSTDNTTTDLLFYLSDDVDDALVGRMKQMVAELGETRAWRLGAPRFIDETNPAESDEDEAIRTVGALLTIAAPQDASGAHLDPSIDRIHYEEVAGVVAGLRTFTTEFQTEVELTLGDTHVGSVADGRTDANLQRGLLDEWDRVLRERERSQQDGANRPTEVDHESAEST